MYKNHCTYIKSYFNLSFKNNLTLYILFYQLHVAIAHVGIFKRKSNSKVIY